MNGDLGISLSLPLGTSNQLEEKRAEILGRAAASAWDQEEDQHQHHQHQQEEEEQSKPLSGDSFHEDHDHDDRMSDNGGIDDEDRVIMPFHLDEQQRDIRNNDDDDDNDNDNDDEEGGSIRSSAASSSSSSDGDDDEDEDDDDNLDDLSLTPPPTMPVLSLDLEKLCGYPPKNQEECQRITTEIRAALLGVVVVVGGGNGKDQKYDDDDDDDGKSKGAQDDTSLDFIARSNELFEAGIARHCSTDNSHDIIDYEHSNESNNEHNHDNHEDPRAIVPYPEFLPLPPNDPSSTSTSTATATATTPSTTSTSTLLSTQRIWKKIIHPHSTPIVQNLLHLLSRCNRTLIWKYQMMHEIRRIASFQSACKNRRVQRELVGVWRRETRPAELAKLYDVRETFVIRLDGARGKLRGFEEEREVRVQRELRRRVEFGQNGHGHGHGSGSGNGKSTGGIAGLDWDTNVTFGFGEDVEDVVQKLLEERRRAGNGNGDGDGNGNGNGNKEYNSFAEDEFDDLDDDDADDDDSEFSDDDNGNVETEASRAADIATPEIEIPLPITSMTDRKKRRAAAAAKRLRKRLHTQQEKSLEHELRGKIERAYAEEEAVRHMLLSTDERMALSTVFHLEKQLEKVDELLESLQEEEWKDEEEGLLEEGGDDENEDEDGVGSADATEDDHGDSVLHQILAMILGAMPDDGSGSSSCCPSREEHFSFLKKEHTTIVEGWKKEFGRLPQLNDDDDNDNDDDEATDGSMGKATNDGDSAALPGRTGYTAEDSGTDMIGATPWDEGEEYLDSKMKGMSLSKNAASQPAVQSGIAPNTMSIFGPTSVPDDWEDAADDDGFEELFRPPEAPIKGDSLDTTSSPSVGAARPRAGLRPGGRIK
jgi:hypothetical protein